MPTANRVITDSGIKPFSVENRASLGRRAEKAAVNFLRSNGYGIIQTDYRVRAGQIDIIARDKNTICFVEVKARRSARFGSPGEAVEAAKQRKISKVALMFLKQQKLLNSPARFDVVSISYFQTQPAIRLIKNAFNLDSRYLY
ncbi:YraN family protein [Candidatus Omnitrophota bacterium]